MKLVLDASMALAWVFERQTSEEIRYANEVLSKVETSEAVVPSLWYTEVANALLVGERRGLISKIKVIDYLAKLSNLSIVTDPITPLSRQESVMAFAREYGLTAYDATYLELALRQNALLATFDAQLAKAMHLASEFSQ